MKIIPQLNRKDNRQMETAESSAGTAVPLLPYYVYILMDPRDNRPFYVGKGAGQRVLQHEADAKRLLKRLEAEKDLEAEERGDYLPVSEKLQKIQDIIVNGKSPRIVIMGRFETAEEAFAVEATLIHFVFGYDALSNVASGHGSKLIRSKRQYEDILATGSDDKITEIEGIDMPIRRGVRDNSFKNAKIEKLSESGAYEFLIELRQILTAHRFKCRNFETAEDMRFHPSESNGYLAVIVEIGMLDLNVQFTASLKISIQLIYTQRTEKGESDKKKLLTYLGMGEFEPKADRKYAWLEPGIKYNSPQKVVERLNQIRDVLEPRQA